MFVFHTIAKNDENKTMVKLFLTKIHNLGTYIFILPCKRQKENDENYVENVDNFYKKKKIIFICFFVCHARAKLIFKMLKKYHNLDIYL